MKKYTKPEVEITAFDFEDITMSTLPAASAKDAFVAANAGSNTIVVDATGISW